MSLVVSLRIADGLVLAADSLSTVHGRMSVAADLKVKCPKCNKEMELKDIKMPPIPTASSTRSFAQKIFPFGEKFGVASWGMSILNRKTIYFHMKELEEKSKNTKFDSVNELAQQLKRYFSGEIEKQIKDLKQAPDSFYALGFQIVGYDKELTGKTIEVNIGKKSRIRIHEGIGCTVSGDIKVVVQLWGLGEQIPAQRTNYHSFSLQDAIDYAEFLINTTTTYQRFANILPTVGGEVDIALITPFRKFAWIKSKKLTRILEEEGGLL